MMSLIENVVSAVKSHNLRDTLNVVDHSPLNWLYITYNTVEELVRVDPNGHIVSAAMQNYKWTDDYTLEIKSASAESVILAFLTPNSDCCDVGGNLSSKASLRI